jgi:hypothetical protein
MKRQHGKYSGLLAPGRCLNTAPTQQLCTNCVQLQQHLQRFTERSNIELTNAATPSWFQLTASYMCYSLLHRTRDAQYVDFGSVQRTVRVQYAVRCLVRCLYAAVKGTCNVLVKVSLEVTY